MRTNLKGRALTLGELWQIDDASYDKAVELLTAKFYNQDQLIDLSLGQLLDSPALRDLGQSQKICF